MSNVYSIVITATDRATATARKVNNAMSRLTRPFAEVGKSFKGLGRELGFQKIGKSLGAIGRQAQSAARGVGSVVSPMLALTGVASVAGVIALADSWANLGRGITNASRSIGGGTDQLQAFQGAAKLVGVSAEAATATLQQLGDTMEDALYGRNQQALMLFNRLGVGIKRTRDGALDATGEFRALATAISRLRAPQQQNLAARELGLTALLPLIRQGPGAIDKLMDRARALGMVMDGPALQSANEFASSLAELKASGEGLRNSLGNALIPAIRPLVQQLGSWVSKNRELIATKVGQWAQDFASWISGVDWRKVGQGIRDLVTGVSSLVDKMGGLKGVAIATGVVLGASFVSNVVSLTFSLGRLGIGLTAVIARFTGLTAAARAAGAATAMATGSSVGLLGRAGIYSLAAVGGWKIGEKVSDALDGTSVGDKFNHAQTKALGGLLSLIGFKDNVFARAARTDGVDQKYYGAKPANSVDAGLQSRVVGYFQQQGWSRAQAAGIAANLIQESSLNPHAAGDNGSAYGLAQWHGDRQAAFQAWSGRPIQGSSLTDQLGFVQYELTKGSEQGAGDLLRRAQTPADAGGVVSRFYERPKDTEGEASSRGALADQIASAPQGPYSAGGAAPGGTVHVQIDAKGLPAGSQVKATSTGDVTTSSPRIGYPAVGNGV